MPDQTRIKKNIRWGLILSYLTILVGVIFTVFYTPFLIKNVGKVEHGIYTFVSSIISWLSILTVGIAGAYVRFATKYHSEQGEKGVSKINNAFVLVLSYGAIVGVLSGIVVLFFSKRALFL